MSKQMMQVNLLWEGREYHSLENCIITITDSGTEINSSIIGEYEQKIYKVDYTIKTNANWETQFLEVKTQLNDKRELLTFISDGKGTWAEDGKPANEFRGCKEVDISLTPFTNTLAIRRLNLSVGESQAIHVIYLDLLNGQIKSVEQNYKRLSLSHYQFENIPNDFSAIITVDELGLVVDYPELFVRAAWQESKNY